MLNVVVLGAGGIVGQHMIRSKPDHIHASFVRRTGFDRTYSRASEPSPWIGVDLENSIQRERALEYLQPDVIVNLAGENRVDIVEQDPARYHKINVVFPGDLGAWCDRNDVRLIHGSTQGIFNGDDPTYGPGSPPSPITWYGTQKASAEEDVCGWGGIVARLTFVLGVRPFPDIGRRNPLEDMIEKTHQLQVNDRFFSPLLATDAAAELWRLVQEDFPPVIVHLGEPLRVSRFSVACEMVWRNGLYGHRIEAVSHEFFEGIAPRPRDTQWSPNARYRTHLRKGVEDAYDLWKEIHRGSDNPSA